MELKYTNIFKKINFKYFLISVIILKSCYTVSHIVVVEAQTPIEYNNVKFFHDYPEFIEKVAKLKQVVI